MENYVVSARKYRPRQFDEVVGQQHVTRTLERAIANNHLAQALLFTGPRGVGKTTCARILAQRINSQGQEEKQTEQDFAFNIFELDAASNNSVEDIRHLTEQVRVPPQTGQYRVYIIDEVHMLSQSAFNAFLKTLEEPPAHAIFILATTEKHKIIPTILSRCQIYDFRRITVEDILGHLKNVAAQEKLSADEEGLRIIAQKADGALRDALSIFDRIASFSEKHISYQDVIDNLRILDYDYYFRAIDFVVEQDHAGLLNLFNEILDNGFDGHLFINGLAAHLRELLVCQNPATLDLLEVGEAIRERYQKQAAEVNMNFLLRGLKSLSDADQRYKSSNNQRLLVELALMELIGHWGKLTEESGEKKKPNPNLETRTTVKTSPYSEKQEVAKPTPPPKEDKAEKSDSQVSEAAPAMAAKPKTQSTASRAESPTAGKSSGKKKSRGSFSISQSMSKNGMESDQEEEPESLDPNAIVTGKPQQAFKMEELQRAWDEFLQKAHQRQERRIVASLSGKKISLIDQKTAELVLDNSIQAEIFEETKGEIIPYCRERLNNYALKFWVKIEEGSQELEPYSPSEKYQYLLAKNPKLALLKSKLNLELN